jgi:hypothetical protein
MCWPSQFVVDLDVIFVPMNALTRALSCAALLAAGFSAPAAAQVSATNIGGEVMFVSGKAERIGRDGAGVVLAKGMPLAEGDRIRTQADSHVYVRLRDGGLLVVRPASELLVELWRYDPAQPKDSKIKYTLDNGVARHVSGQAAKAARESFRFNTPMAAIGVRGTDFTVLADPGVTRVSVQTGGVIVSGLGDGCRVEGLGPCEGASSVELLASAKDKLLQVRRGERRPELIEDTAISPDKARPPVSGEPAVRAPLSSTDLQVAESRATELVSGQVIDKKIVPPQPVEPPIATWGRWAAIAAGDAGMIDAGELLKGRTLVGVNTFYLLAANKPAFEMPGAGVGKFSLTAHDGVISDKLTGENRPSTASNTSLSIDFASRRFETSMSLKAGDLATEISAKGSVEPTGRFMSDAFVSSSIIQGLTGGKDASQAMYLYQRSIDSRFQATGATSWSR